MGKNFGTATGRSYGTILTGRLMEQKSEYKPSTCEKYTMDIGTNITGSAERIFAKRG